MSVAVDGALVVELVIAGGAGGPGLAEVVGFPMAVDELDDCVTVSGAVVVRPDELPWLVVLDLLRLLVFLIVMVLTTVVVVLLPECVEVDDRVEGPPIVGELATKAISALPSFKSFSGLSQQDPLLSPSQQYQIKPESSHWATTYAAPPGCGRILGG